MDEIIIEQVICELARVESDDVNESISVVSAFATHKWRYDGARRSYTYLGNRFHLHASASARIAMLEERLDWVYGRCLRHEAFRPPPPGIRRNDVHRKKLHRVDELAGVMADLSGGARESPLLYLIGMLTQPEDGTWCLEDSGHSVEIDISSPALQRSLGLFTETCVLLAQGVYAPDDTSAERAGAVSGGDAVAHAARGAKFTALTEGRISGVFRVMELAHPPFEKRVETLRQMATVDTLRVIPTPADFARNKGVEEKRTDAMIAVFSGVCADSPPVLANLRTVLSGFSSANSIPSVFVLMGNFSSRPFGAQSSDAAAFRSGMDALAAVLTDFPEIAAVSHFVLVPGAGDPGSAPVLPRPALPNSLCKLLLDTEKLPRVTLATNPCRLRFFTQEITIFCGDVSTRLHRASAISPDPPPDTEQPLSQHVTETLFSQGHLLPLPLASQPVYWEMDHALRISPAPDVLILGEQNQRFWANDFNDALIFCPGDFTEGESFAVYRPALRSVEPCDVHPRDDE